MRLRSRSRPATLPLLATMLALGVIAPASTAKPPTIYINGDSAATYKFTPATLNVQRGATVHWMWDSNGPHNVTFRKLGKSSITGASEKYGLKFKRRGTFKYLCTVHGFRGKIIVG